MKLDSFRDTLSPGLNSPKARRRNYTQDTAAHRYPVVAGVAKVATSGHGALNTFFALDMVIFQGVLPLPLRLFIARIGQHDIGAC